MIYLFYRLMIAAQFMYQETRLLNQPLNQALKEESRFEFKELRRCT